MMKTIAALAILLAASDTAKADPGEGAFEAERVDEAPVNLFQPPGPIYDEAGRLVVAPPPSPDLRSARDVLLRLPDLPEPAGAASFESRRTAFPRRGER
jgi:hypothetical protein